MRHDRANDVCIAIIDDNPGSVELMSSALLENNVQVISATDPEEGLDLVFRRHPQIVITDLVMPKMSGMQVLERIVNYDPAIDVVLITGHYSTDSAIEAIKKGAADYLTKPVSPSLIRERTKPLIEHARRQRCAVEVERNLFEISHFEGLIGRSPKILEVLTTMRRVAPHYRSLLVTGQTGTGKDLIARAIHRLSNASGNFVVLNCSAVVETLFESELFGHVKGSFTGADRDKVGFVEHASGGTLFLDEIGDMPLSTQAKLLRVLQNQEVQRVGSLTPRKVDVRVIAATNKDLRSAIAERTFREDLYYRLGMVDIHVPALTERVDDLPLLIRHFTDKFARQFGKSIHGVTHRAQIVLGRHTWPGNVRELENAIGHACMFVTGDTIDVEDLPAYLLDVHHPELVMAASAGNSVGHTIDSLDAHEQALVTNALERANGNQSEAARLLKIGRDAFRYKMKKFNLA